MEEKIRAIKAEIEGGIGEHSTSESLYQFRKKYLDNKEGAIPALMKGMKDVPKEKRPEMGKVVNEVKTWALEKFEQAEKAVKAAELAAKNESERIDVTMPAKLGTVGGLHPNTIVANELIDIFAGMGFEILEGREIENDYYNFTALNTPKDHPARDMQDTFYLSEDFLLRTQTSTGQIHAMEAGKPPIKMLSPGKVFRSDDDATHSPMFTQMEGLVVDEGITLCDLKGMLDTFSERIFGEGVHTRLRPSYFPFTEPSVEVDVSCFACVRAPAGSKYWVPAWSIAMCWKTAASIRKSIPALPSVWAWSVLPCSNTASTTLKHSTNRTPVLQSNSKSKEEKGYVSTP